MTKAPPYYSVIFKRPNLTMREFRIASPERMAKELGLTLLRTEHDGVEKIAYFNSHHWRDNYGAPGWSEWVEFTKHDDGFEIIRFRVIASETNHSIEHHREAIGKVGKAADRSGPSGILSEVEFARYGAAHLTAIAPQKLTYVRYVAEGFRDDDREYSCGATLDEAAAGLLLPSHAYDTFTIYAAKSATPFSESREFAFCDIVDGDLETRNVDLVRVCHIE